MKKWKKFEGKTTEIIRELNPKAEVVPNVFLEGKLSLKKRQIDVKLVEPGQYDFIVFECKDHGRPLDIPVIEAFSTKLQDISAKRGAVVSSSGFTDGAENMASNLGIDLLALVDTGDPEIKTKLYASMIISDVFVDKYAIRINFTGEMVGSIPSDSRQMRISIGHSSKISSPPEIFKDLWNNTELLKKERGAFEYTVNSKIISSLTEEVPCMLTFIYEVVEKHFLGKVEIIDARGIYNFKEGGFQTRSLKTEVINAYEKEKVWNQISTEEAKSMKVSMRLSCASLFPEEDRE
jgi:hypothetical protein